MSFQRIAPEQHDTLDGVREPAENPLLLGHRESASRLATAYRDGKLPHAMLFSGPPGIGKATLAYHLAHHLLANPHPANAPSEFATPDMGSGLWRQIATGAHPSVLHLTRPWDEKNKRFKTVLSVDEIRRVGRFLSLTSHDGSYRVVIVDAADDMNVSAANALLKSLEEPPSQTVFVLIAHAPGGLLPTIRSRCQSVRLAPLKGADLLGVLEAAEQPLPQSAEARQALVERSGGSARLAILLTQYGGLEISQTTDKLVRTEKLDILGAHQLADVVGGRGQDIPFGVFNDHVLDVLAAEASTAARAGAGGRADAISQAFEESRIAIIETDTYNLDRKQHALNMITRLHDALRM
jgi:DNA polymerase-3 subunit delta'